MNAKAILLVLMLAAPAAAQQTCYVTPSYFGFAPHSAYCQPVFQQQFVPVYVYQSGYDLERKALVYSTVQEYQRQQAAAGVKAGYGSDAILSQSPQAIQQGNQAIGSQTQQPRSGLAQANTQAAGNVLASKCSVCHGAAKPEGGIVLDGSQSITAQQFHRAFQIFGQNVRVPEKMQSLVSGMQTADKGQIFSELAQLVQGGALGAAPGEQPPPVPMGERQEPMR